MQSRMKPLLILIFFSQQCLAQIIPTERSVDWTSAGLTFTHEWPMMEVNLEQFGGKGDGLTSNNEAFDEAIHSFDGKRGKIHLGKGTYLFDGPIVLRDSILLSGEGTDLTTIIFISPASGDLIQLIGSKIGVPHPITDSPERGQTYIVSPIADNLSPGDYVNIYMEDSSLITSDWARGTVGQIVRVTEIHEDTVRIDVPLRLDYPANTHPEVQLINPLYGAGIECVKIIRAVNDTFQSSTILMQYTAECYVKGVEIDSCNYAHITLSGSTHCSVRNSYLHDAYDYGGGGKGYGVMVQNTTSDCLIENNIFKKLRHSMIIQSGANGNVFGYNYSIEPYWTEVSLPANAAGDLVLHGNYPYANLFEGNIGQQIVIDDSHGINGPFNTFFRNRLELYGIFMNNNPATNYVNLVGNEVTNSTFTYGLYLLFGNDHFLYGNNIRGMISPSGTENLTDTSYYLQGKPKFLDKVNHFPIIGTPNIINTGEIPAKTNYSNNHPTICSEDSTITLIQSTSQLNTLTLIPNPTIQKLSIAGLDPSTGNIELTIFSFEGRILFSKKYEQLQSSLDVSALHSGSYFIRIIRDNAIYIGKFIKL